MIKMVAAEENREENEFDVICNDYELLVKKIPNMKGIIDQQEKIIDEFENRGFDSDNVASQYISNDEITLAQNGSKLGELAGQNDETCGDSIKDEKRRNSSIEDPEGSENVTSPSNEVDVKEKSNLYSLLKSFMESSTLHGLPKLVDSSTWVRILWALAMLGAITALSLQIHGLIHDYLSFGVVTEVGVKQGNMAFPTTIVCNNRPFLASKLVSIPLFANFSTQVDDPMNAWQLKKEFLQNYHDLTPKELYDLGSDVSDTIAVHTVPDEGLSKIEVVPYRGSCYSIQAPAGTTSMVIAFNIHINDSIGPRLTTEYPGILIRFKDSPLAFPFTEPVFGFHSYVGLEVRSVITHELMNRLNGSYGQCQNGEQSFYDRTGIAYEQQACVNECAFMGVLSKCQCLFRSPNKEISEFLPFWLKQVAINKVSFPICKRKTDRKCFSKIGRNRKHCPCKPKCHIKRYSATYKGYDILDNYNCEKNPNDLVCDMVRKWAPGLNVTNEWLQTSVVVTKLTMTQKPYKIYTQKPEYPFLHFLADIGGTMGFYLGASMLTYFELVHFGLASILYLFSVVRNKF